MMKRSLLTAVAAVLAAVASSAAADSVQGEKRDSGLGALPPTYNAAEYLPVVVLGEKLDSGLGTVSREEVMLYVRKYQRLQKEKQQTAALR